MAYMSTSTGSISVDVEKAKIIQDRLRALKSSVTNVESTLQSYELSRSSGDGACALRDMTTELTAVAQATEALIDRSNAMIQKVLSAYQMTDEAIAQGY